MSYAADTPRQQAWTVLNQGLTNNDLEKRTRAVGDLGLLIDDPQAVDAGLTALQDQKPEVRTAAAQSLGEMGAKSAKPELTKALQDTDASVILAAGHALIVLGDNSGYNVFYAVLTGKQKTGESLIDQQKKVLNDPKKLASLGFQAGLGFVPFGSIGLSAYKLITRDDASPVLSAAALTLAKDPDPRSGEALANAAIVQKKWPVRAAAYEAIAKRSDPALLKDAEDGLQDQQPEVQYAAAAAVIRLSDIGAGKAKAPAAHSRPPAKR
jgi:hypothetical protein